jgi:hypothetical protein
MNLELDRAEAKSDVDALYRKVAKRWLVLQRLLEDGAEVRPGYTLEYCALSAIDLHGVVLQAALNAASRD